MNIADSIFAKAQNKKGERTLVFAEDMCHRHKFVSCQELGKIYTYRDGYYQPIKSASADASIHNIIINHDGGRQFTPAKRNAVISNIEALTNVPSDSLDPEGVINFPNGVYNIADDRFIPHSPDILCTKRIDYIYDQNAKAPLWDKFIREVTAGDINKLHLLQEFAGYGFMRSCRFEKALFLSGRGANGKSTFTETLQRVYGRINCSSVSLDGLSNEVMRCGILGKTINVDTDMPKNANNYEEVFKKITSGEPILFNEKYIPAVTISPYCKLVFALNEFPSIDDPTSAFFRRMILVPFDVEFSSEQIDVNLKEKLSGELPGIFNWMVAGYKRLMLQGGFSRNIYMENEIKELRADNNSILAYADEQLVLTKSDAGITKAGLYKHFVFWAQSHGYKPLAYRRFNARFYSEFRKYTEKDFRHGPAMNRVRVWPGIAYSPDATYPDLNSSIHFGQISLSDSLSDSSGKSSPDWTD